MSHLSWPGVGMLEVEAVSKSFDAPGGRLEVLCDVAFSVGEGRRLVVMGPSGSGKSTLLSILGTLDTPTAGCVRLDGETVFRPTPREQSEFRNRRIGCVFQEHHLLDGCSAIDNVLLPVLAESTVDDAALERARILLRRVGLGDRERHLPSQLSGGERQRVAVARAVVRRPRLILADEPTGQLHAAAAVEVVDLLARLAAEENGILVVVTHSHAVADRLIADGRGSLGTLSSGRLTIG